MDHYYAYKSSILFFHDHCFFMFWERFAFFISMKFFYDNFNKFYSFNLMFKSVIHLKLTLVCGERFEVEIHFSFIYPLVTVPFVKFGVIGSQFTVNSDSQELFFHYLCLKCLLCPALLPSVLKNKFKLLHINLPFSLNIWGFFPEYKICICRWS